MSKRKRKRVFMFRRVQCLAAAGSRSGGLGLVAEQQAALARGVELLRGRLGEEGFGLDSVGGVRLAFVVRR